MSSLAQHTTGASRLFWTAGIVLGASLPHWTRLPIWITVLLIACVSWRFAIRLLRWPAPGKWILRLMTLTAFAGVWLQFNTINGLVPGTGLLVVMVALKFLESGNQRDHMILTVIAYFLVFASLLDGGSMFGAAYLIAFAWITTLGLIQVGRQGTLLPGRVSGRLAGKLILQSLPFMLVLFVVFPRMSGPLWSSPFNGGSALTGLSSQMSPGDITDLGLSDEIAFRVDFASEAPEPSDFYWRGPVLSDFDGRTWSWRQTRPRGDNSQQPEFIGQRSDYTITVDVESRGWLFALDMPQNWSPAESRRRIWMTEDYQLYVPADPPPGLTVRYSVTSYSDYRAREQLRPDQLERFTALELAERNPRTRALIERLQADAPDPLTLVERILNYFVAEEFYYTFAPPALGEHTADEFLFDTREGFCGHFASAFAIMMRMAGIPARVVTGYLGAEYNPWGDYYIVRQANAHAWTEIWIEEYGWIRFDPVATVAPDRVLLGSNRSARLPVESFTQRLGNSGFLRQLSLGWDALHKYWTDWVIGYSPALQRDLLEKLGLEQISRQALLLITILTTGLLMLALTFYLSLSMRRWHTSTDAASKSFGQFVRKLERCAVEPQKQGETPSAYAARAATAIPDSRDRIIAITKAYLAARYEPDRGGQALDGLIELVRNFNPRYVRASR